MQLCLTNSAFIYCFDLIFLSGGWGIFTPPVEGLHTFPPPYFVLFCTGKMSNQNLSTKRPLARSLVTNHVVFAGGGRRVCSLQNGPAEFAFFHRRGNRLRHTSRQSSKTAPLEALEGNVSSTTRSRHAEKMRTVLQAGQIVFTPHMDCT